MKKRQVMMNLEPPTTQNEEGSIEVEPADLDDKDIFSLPKKDESVQEITNEMEKIDLETPTTKKTGRDYSHLTKAREKSLEARRKKKEEKEKLDVDAQAYKERMEYERLCKKFNKDPVPQRVAEVRQPEPEPEPYEHKGSANVEAYSAQSVIDYDRIVNGVTSSLSKNEKYFRDMEMKIREDERKKNADEMKKWQQDQHRKQQANNAMSLLSGGRRRNNVFDRTQSLRDSYTQRYKNNWY